MSQIVPLDNVRHAHLRVVAAGSGEAVNLAPLFVTEFAEAQRHYPILFRKDEGGVLQAFAILGFDRDENLFLGRDGWDGYVPAIFRKGPFLLQRGEGHDPVIVVDLEHSQVRDGGTEGMPLFLEHGGHAPALDSAIAALRQIHLAGEAGTMQALFEALDLIEPVRLQVEISDTKVIDFEGFSAVNEERIGALDGPQLLELNRAGMLVAAVHAASSLANMARLISRKRQRDGASG